MFFSFPPFAKEIQPVMDVVNGAIFVVLFLTFIYGILQFRWERQAERISNKEEAARELAHSRSKFARELYRDYLITAIKYPQLSSAIYDKNDGIVKDQYDTFISIMLYAFDEMINQGGDEKKYWTPVIEGQVEAHKEYMEELFGENAEGGYDAAYSSELMEIIRGKLKSLSKDAS